MGFGVQSLPRTGYGVQDILHMGHEVGAYLGNALLPLLPRLEDVFFKCSRTVSWDSDGANPNSTTLSASSRQGPVVVAFRRRAAGQRDEVGLAPVVQLPVPMGLGPVLQHPSQSPLGKTPLDPEYRALGHIQGLGHLGRRPTLIGLQQYPGPGSHSGWAFTCPYQMLQLVPLLPSQPDRVLPL